MKTLKLLWLGGLGDRHAWPGPRLLWCQYPHGRRGFRARIPVLLVFYFRTNKHTRCELSCGLSCELGCELVCGSCGWLLVIPFSSTMPLWSFSDAVAGAEPDHGRAGPDANRILRHVKFEI